ncbi:FAD-dependent monooxygenase [Bradyrhizobium symbiodeficiens]|uniref:FAD-dependent monooxygenase n=1 Tax=Bradyrhizobium symbiodeficiens TaxID=1404367 RepID=UPI00140F828A|nr:FAD-dependent monooxygenase [Bradyrhizobium symbiodeficiens]QIO98526.1 FAD-binding monooxygenase [Bradyrhizobium symbiodeficiens]
MTDTVLIVGAGPVGLTMALELARYQVPVRLIDKMTKRGDTSRAIAIWPRTLELLDRAGASAELIALGNKVTAANIIAGSEPMARVQFDDVDTPYPFALMLPQSDTEAVLERHLERFSAPSELGVELITFTQDADGVTATLRHADGRVEAEKFGWLIACDGSHSPIRHSLGLSFEGGTMGTDWALGDFHMTGSPYPLNELFTYWHEDGPLIFFPMAPGRYRIIASLAPSNGAMPVPPSPEAFQAIVDRRGSRNIVLGDAVWTSTFRINERQISTYRAGRVFLAGDAAHVHSPAGGQGMNTGMQDAINLAWKLAMVCRGLSANPSLLDSYDTERRPVGAEVIATAGRLTKIATIHNPIAQHVRNVVAHFALGLSPVQQALKGSMTEISIGYHDSPLNDTASGNSQAGKRMRPLDDEIPYGAGDTPRFTLRAGRASGEPTPALRSDLVDPAIRPAAHGAGIELMRPDGYLAVSAAARDWASIETYLDRLAKGSRPRPHDAALRHAG